MRQLPPLGVQPQGPKICDGRVQLYSDRQLFGVFFQEEKGWDNSKQQIDLLLQELTQSGQFLDSNTVPGKFSGKPRKRGVLQCGQEDEINRFTAYGYFCAWRAGMLYFFTKGQATDFGAIQTYHYRRSVAKGLVGSSKNGNRAKVEGFGFLLPHRVGKAFDGKTVCKFHWDRVFIQTANMVNILELADPVKPL